MMAHDENKDLSIKCFCPALHLCAHMTLAQEQPLKRKTAIRRGKTDCGSIHKHSLIIKLFNGKLYERQNITVNVL